MNKKNMILDVADELFANNGYNVSMSDIAKKVGIKVPSIYSHYTNKDEIILLIIEREINRFYSFLFEKMKTMNNNACEENLKNLYYIIIDYIQSKNRLRFWKNISLIQNPELKTRCVHLIYENERILNEKIENIFNEGMKSGNINGVNPKAMTSLYFALIKGVMDMMILYQYPKTELTIFLDNVWNEYYHLLKSRT